MTKKHSYFRKVDGALEHVRVLRRDLGERVAIVDELEIRHRYSTQEQRKKSETELLSGNRLTPATVVMDDYEKIFRDAFLDLQNMCSSALYKPLVLQLKDNFKRDGFAPKMQTYLPFLFLPFHHIGDENEVFGETFVLGEKSVVIQPSPPYLISSSYIKHLKRFRDAYDLYIALATTRRFELNALSEQTVRDNVDEFWYVESRSEIGRPQARGYIKELLKKTIIGESSLGSTLERMESLLRSDN